VSSQRNPPKYMKRPPHQVPKAVRVRSINQAPNKRQERGAMQRPFFRKGRSGGKARSSKSQVPKKSQTASSKPRHRHRRIDDQTKRAQIKAWHLGFFSSAILLSLSASPQP